MNIPDVLYGRAKNVPDALAAGYDALARAVSGSPEKECRIESAYAWKGAEKVEPSNAAKLFRTERKGLAKAVDMGVGVSVFYDILVKTGALPSEITEEMTENLSDGNVPGIAVFIGKVSEERKKDVEYCIDAGLTVLLSGEYSRWRYDSRNVFGISDFDVLAINGILASAAVGKKFAEPGDYLSVAKTLKKKSGLVVIHTGTPTVMNVLQIFSAAAAGAYIVSDTINTIPRLSEHASENMAERALIGRGIVSQEKTSGKGRIRRTDTFFEAGGPDAPVSFVSAVYSGDGDFSVNVIGKELPESEGAHTFGIEIRTDTSNPAVLRAAVMLAQETLDGTDGIWHSGSGTSFWIRISKDGKENGLTFYDIGKTIRDNAEKRLKNKIGVTVSADSDYVNGRLAFYAENKEPEISDETADCFYTCTMCQTYAPNHICIITPDRPGVCGSVTWTDAAAGSMSNPGGLQRPFPKGIPIDSKKGEWSGINELMNTVSMGAVKRVCLHSLEAPMTSCGCMQAFAALSADGKSIIIVDRTDSGINPSGITYGEASSIIGRGGLCPGMVGIGRRYILSPAFLREDGGIKRISWMGSRLKSLLGEPFRELCEEVHPGLYGMIADEKSVHTPEELAQWISEKNHPAAGMPFTE